ncbi:2-oxoglutarate dehydrogenase E2, dihydrolipoamide succinyltransferase [Mycobacterium xenopi 4042]|uniref:Dihydrolipoamide acetyltransferase component of pyruvate dehydrogenase complex n=1 Tax=Mycobacterium xenopi 4042 TaxID=1299334 RepID=X8DCB3_MYCXE|nr:2-oxoglutarate dehydrogenase E2, dihydrolipoamide succinyltransferase [Mycobacterium xenopi 4042]
MPALGESVTEGTVTRWLKQEGDTVEVDEPLLEVSTDKVDTEIPSPAAGVLTKIIAHEDETVEVGGELAIIGDTAEADGGQPSAEAPPSAEASTEPETAAKPNRAADRHGPAGDGGQGATTPVLMPELGESVTEGTVTRWLKKVGDSVQVDEPLVEVSTDKVDTEIPSPVAGTLVSITAEEDTTVPVGGELAKIGTAAAPRLSPSPPSRSPNRLCSPHRRPRRSRRRPCGPALTRASAHRRAGSDAREGRNTVCHAAGAKTRRRQQHRPDPGEGHRGGWAYPQAGRACRGPTAGRGEEGASSRRGAPAAARPAAAPSPAPALAHLRGTTQKASRIRQITAAKTRESLLATAQLTQTHEVDMTKIVALRARAKAAFAEREGVNLTYLPFIARAVIDALKIHPNINASYNEETKEITYYDAEHLGFAVDTEQGLLSPVIHNAGDLSLAGLARAIADIAARARSGDLKPDELSGARSRSPTSAARARFTTRRSWSRLRPPCSAPAQSSNGRGWSSTKTATSRSGSAPSAICR